ncbi:hypothetical protein STANM309S_03330 [Streptomyces tanashiensis]
MPSNTTAPPGKKTAKKKGRRARLLLLVLVLALVAGMGFGGYWGVSTVRASFPQTTGEIRLDKLSADVDVKRDANGVPQIYADNETDLFRAQGYVQAQDRFYEMDVRRHVTAGRLSEMFGASQVDTDAFLRTLGWRRVAQEEYDKVLSPETKKYLQAYAEGVNAYLKDRAPKEISVEYAALGLTNDYTIEPWTPVDSVAWLKAMAWDLRGNMQDEIDRSLMTSRLSAQQIKQLYPEYAVRAPPADPGRRRGRRVHREVRPRGRRDRGRRDDHRGHAGHGPGRRERRSVPPSSARSPRSSTPSPRCSAPTATASARTPGSSPGSTRPPAIRCSPTTRTSRPSCRPSGTRWACTAARSRPPAATTSTARPGSSTVSAAHTASGPSRGPVGSSRPRPAFASASRPSYAAQSRSLSGSRTGSRTRTPRAWRVSSNARVPGSRPTDT